MSQTICLFEDPHYRNLLPLLYTRPVYDLRCGLFTLQQKIRRAYPKASVVLLCRPYLADVVRQQNPNVLVNAVHASSCLLLNGRMLADANLAKKIPLKGNNAVYFAGNTVVAVRINEENHDRLDHDFSGMSLAEHFSEYDRITIDVELVEYTWDLVNRNGEQIVADFESLSKDQRKGKKARILPGVHILNKKNVLVGSGAVVKPGVVLDAENGPIFIGRNARILPNAVIEGPAFIGDNTIIKIGAKIYENTSIGEMCKVGGEVESSILHSYSNKQHDGFLGHSYIGMWCNLGADTNNSDLKNNYGSVKVFVNGKEVNTGSRFVGLTMGDHSKSGINTMFNTGTVVGVSSNVFGGDFPPKYIPSFAWGGAVEMDTYDVEKAIDVARQVMLRRKVDLTGADEMMLRKVFDLTVHERS